MRRFIFILSIGLLLISGFSCSDSGVDFSQETKVSVPFGRQYNYSDILVARVVDGDTLKLENGERVRLIGIDTPEMHDSDKLYRDSSKTGKSRSAIKELGKKAYWFTRELVERKRVKLVFDVEKRDKYGRLLAYVYLKDGTFVNARIIEAGFASLMTFPPNVRHVDLFKRLYRQARENKTGLWADE